jgi:membrane-bound serine protease (ClpP class)
MRKGFRFSLRRWLLSVGTLLTGGLLAGCTTAPILNDPTGSAFVNNLLATLANPNIAYLLLVVGLLGITAEVTTPGVVFPGVVGVICLLLSGYGLLNLPTNWLGLILILAGVAMFVADLHVAGFALSIGGLIAFGLGSLFIFTPFWASQAAATDTVRLNPWLIVGTTAGIAAFFMFGLSAAMEAQSQPVAVGRETMLERVGIVRQPLQPEGIVHIEGEEWTAISVTGEELPVGTRVRVVEVDGLRLRVEPLDEDQ